VRNRLPDLVLLDLHLPDLPGEEVLRQIWEDPATRRIPVAVLSADATPAQHRRLLAAGAIAYLTKPFDIAEVLRLVDRILTSRVQNRSEAMAASGGVA
jgi:CheY-like chemotaxis protein